LGRCRSLLIALRLRVLGLGRRLALLPTATIEKVAEKAAHSLAEPIALPVKLISGDRDGQR
jgi:hypothetical protein